MDTPKPSHFRKPMLLKSRSTKKIATKIKTNQSVEDILFIK